MKQLMSYSGLTTKIRALESNFLTEEDLRELVSLESVAQAVTFLKQKKEYAPLFQTLDENQLHRGQVEKLLRVSVYSDFTKIYRFSNIEQRNFLTAYFRRYEVEVIKDYMRNIFDHREVKLNLSDFEVFFKKHSKLDLNVMSNYTTIEELVASLKNTDYFLPLSKLSVVEKPTLFDYEMALDQYNFTSLWKRYSDVQTKSESADLAQALGTKYDLLNINWIYRCKKYYKMSSADIYSLLIPVNYRLSKQEVSQLVEADSVETLEGLIEKTFYAKKYEGFNAKSMENMYAEIVGHLLKILSRREPYSVATLYSYLHHKEHEVGRIIIALESVRYRIPPDEAIVYVHST